MLRIAAQSSSSFLRLALRVILWAFPKEMAASLRPKPRTSALGYSLVESRASLCSEYLPLRGRYSPLVVPPRSFEQQAARSFSSWFSLRSNSSLKAAASKQQAACDYSASRSNCYRVGLAVLKRSFSTGLRATKKGC